MGKKPYENIVGEGDSTGNQHFLLSVAFVEDNATMSSIRYFESHVLYFVQNRRKYT